MTADIMCANLTTECAEFHGGKYDFIFETPSCSAEQHFSVFSVVKISYISVHGGKI
jgi:hypothetical protein